MFLVRVMYSTCISRSKQHVVHDDAGLDRHVQPQVTRRDVTALRTRDAGSSLGKRRLIAGTGVTLSPSNNTLHACIPLYNLERLE